MQATELNREGLNVSFKVVLPITDIENRVSSELGNLSKKIKMDGFRVGKVPLHIVKKKYYADIRRDIVQDMINESINSVSKAQVDSTISSTAVEEFNNSEGKDIEFVIKFELIPKFEMPNFADITLEKYIVNDAEKEIEKILNDIAKSSPSYDVAVEVAKQGDCVTIDAVGYIDGVAFEGGRVDNYRLVLGSGSFIPGFEEQLIGSKISDKVTVKVPFPLDYHVKNLAGKNSEFVVDVLAVQGKTEQLIDDNLAMKLQHENLESLKEAIRQDLIARYDSEVHSLMVLNLFNKLEEILDFLVPKSLLDKELQFIKENVKNSTDTEEEIKEGDLERIAARRVRIGLLLAEYAKLADIRVNDQDINNAVIAEINKYPNQSKEIISYYKNNRNAVNNLMSRLMETKAIDDIIKNKIISSEVIISSNELRSKLDKAYDKL